jgi:HK97 family phage major capsid protein
MPVYKKLNLQYFSETKTADELLNEIKNNTDKFSKTLEKQQEEIKKFGTTSDKTVEQIADLEKNYGALEQQLKDMKAQQVKQARPVYGGEGEEAQEQSAGRLFTGSDAYKNMIQSGEQKSAPVRFKSFFKKDLTSAPTSAGQLVVPQRTGDIITPEQELRIRDLLNVQTTTSNALEYVEETGFTNNAAPVVEGSLKPQSDLTFDVKTATVKTIAHWVPATRQILDDAAQLRSYIDNRLTYGLKLIEEQQLLYGDGTGENLQGLMTNADVQTNNTVAEGDTKIDHLRRSMTKSILAGYPVTGMVLNPLDWEDIELMKGSDGHYVWISVTEGGTPRIFRVPVVQTPAMVESEFLLGAFGIGATLWDREQANVRVSESHADFFARNMVAILAEERLALTTYRPESFVKGGFAAAGAGA